MDELREKQLPCYIYQDTSTDCNEIRIILPLYIQFMCGSDQKQRNKVYENKLGFYFKKLAKKLFVT